ncbi:sigma-70 family RNA polymerase sigma factor [Rhizobium sp. AN80A]|uniref:sigma-70 family RNA polymerase sigma factor n=1 Tax=Rhizobium sp. AN80A TaxID=3040673 RepID=UPI0032C46B8F
MNMQMPLRTELRRALSAEAKVWPTSSGVAREVDKLEEEPVSLDAGRIKALMSAVADSRDIGAFELLYRYFYPRVRSYMVKMTRGNRILAEELAQETMMRVWHKAGLFDPARAQASTWIFTIARNQMIDSVRKSSKPDFDPNDPAFVPDDFEAADVLIERQQSAAALGRAMATLKGGYAEVLRLSFFEGLTHSTIAEKLNLPIGTVKSRIRLACEKLRTALQDEAK